MNQFQRPAGAVREQPPARPARSEGSDATAAPGDVGRSQSSDNWDWIVTHADVLDEFRGEYIAIWEQRVVLHGPDPRVLHEALRHSPYWDKPLLVFRVPTRDEVDSLLVL